MNTCWKCKNPLRIEGTAFCPLCGAAQKTDDPAAAGAWQVRINQTEQSPSWGLSFLWLLAWPIAAFTYPIFLVRAERRLKRHVKQRLASPALTSPRFTQSAEGQQIVRRLERSVGKLTAGGAWPAVLIYMVLAVMAFMVFIVPCTSPTFFQWDDGFEAVFEVRGVRSHYYVQSAQQYEVVWDQIARRRYTRAVVHSYPVYNMGVRPSAPIWSNGETDTPIHHRPFQYLIASNYRTGYEAMQVNSINVYWDGTIAAGIAFYIGLALVYLSFVAWGLVFWFRFMRHAQVEALTAAYATGDVKYHDMLLPRVQRRNTLMAVAMVPLVILPFPPLHIVFFAMISAGMFARHYSWERSTGIASALGITR